MNVDSRFWRKERKEVRYLVDKINAGAPLLLSLLNWMCCDVLVRRTLNVMSAMLKEAAVKIFHHPKFAVRRV